MANLELPFGVRVLNPVPVDAKYLKEGAPYTNIADVNNSIVQTTRHIGLTVNIAGVEYWYRDGVSNSDLIVKQDSAEAKKEYVVIPISDLITNLTVGTTKAYFRIPFFATLNSVSASVLVAQTGGNILTFDINENGNSMLSTKITIDNNEKTSITATTQPVIANTALEADSEITFDIDQVGTAGAKGAVITLNLTRV